MFKKQNYRYLIAELVNVKFYENEACKNDNYRYLIVELL